MSPLGRGVDGFADADRDAVEIEAPLSLCA